MVDTVVLKDSAAIEFFNNEMALVKINGKKDTALSAEYHVSGYPTLVLLGADGKEIDRLVGYIPPKPFIQRFRDYAKGIKTLDALLEMATTKTDRGLFMEIGRKFKYRGGDDDATYWYKKAFEEGDQLDSLAGECRLELAEMHRRASDYDKALADFASITKDFNGLHAGGQAEIWTAIIYEKMDDTTKAIAHYEAFIKNYPDHKDAKYCEGKIKKLTEPQPTEGDQSH